MGRKIQAWAACAVVIIGLAVLAEIEPVKAQDAPPQSDAAAVALVQRDCVGCHELDVVTAQGRSAKDWSDVVDRMVDHGLEATNPELAQIKAYLAKAYPAAAR